MSAHKPDEFFEVLFSEKHSGKEGLYHLEDYLATVHKWRQIFSRALHAKTGEWCLGGYDWHIFTFGYRDALVGSDAISAYHALEKCSAYVFTHSVQQPRCCLTNELPSHNAISHALSRFPKLADIYVMEKQSKWTFVVTHEEKSGIGPFFAMGDVKWRSKRLPREISG